MHAAVYRDLVARGMDEGRARDLVSKAQGGSPAEILEDVQTQMRTGAEPPPLPPEAHSNQNLEQRSIPPIQTPQDAERGMTDEEAGAFMDRLNAEIERRRPSAYRQGRIDARH